METQKFKHEIKQMEIAHENEKHVPFLLITCLIILYETIYRTS